MLLSAYIKTHLESYRTILKDISLWFSSRVRKQGRVKWFNKRRGFGFIVDVDDDTKEYFCHHSAVNPNTNCWRILHEGEYVEFDLENGKQGEQCVNVTGLRGGPLRCDLMVDKSRNRPSEHNINQENKND